MGFGRNAFHLLNHIRVFIRDVGCFDQIRGKVIEFEFASVAAAETVVEVTAVYTNAESKISRIMLFVSCREKCLFKVNKADIGC